MELSFVLFKAAPHFDKKRLELFSDRRECPIEILKMIVVLLGHTASNSPQESALASLEGLKLEVSIFLDALTEHVVGRRNCFCYEVSMRCAKHQIAAR